MEFEGYKGSYCTVDTLITRGPARLIRIMLDASTDGGGATIYDGTNTNGKLVGIFYGLKKQTTQVDLDVKCNQGLYLDIGSDMTSCLVVWEPLAVQ